LGPQFVAAKTAIADSGSQPKSVTLNPTTITLFRCGSPIDNIVQSPSNFVHTAAPTGSNYLKLVTLQMMLIKHLL